MADRRPRGLLDTSVVIGMGRVDRRDLPERLAVSTLTLAELASGPHATPDPAERAKRQERLQRAEALFEPVSFDVGASRAYGQIAASVVAAGRKARGRRLVNLLIAATALEARLPLYTANPEDLSGLETLLEVVSVPLSA